MASGSNIGFGDLFENAEVTTSGRPVLRRNEVECFLLSSVDLDSEDDPPRFNALREPRGGRSSLFDGIEEGGIRAASSYSHEINEHENERALEGLQDRVILLKRIEVIEDEDENESDTESTKALDLSNTREMRLGPSDATQSKLRRLTLW